MLRYVLAWHGRQPRSCRHGAGSTPAAWDGLCFGLAGSGVLHMRRDQVRRCLASCGQFSCGFLNHHAVGAVQASTPDGGMNQGTARRCVSSCGESGLCLAKSHHRGRHGSGFEAAERDESWSGCVSLGRSMSGRFSRDESLHGNHHRAGTEADRRGRGGIGYVRFGQC